MIPKCFKLLRKGEGKIPGIYIRYEVICGSYRPIYIGETDNILGSRPIRTDDLTAGDYQEVRRLESVSNKNRRKEYEAALIIKLEPLKQRINENLFMYKKYFSIAKKANLLNKEIKRDRLKKIIDFSVYEKTLKKLEELYKKAKKINSFYEEYFNFFCSNKTFKEWKKPGMKYFGTSLNNDRIASDLIYIINFINDLNKLEKYMNKKQKNLNKFRRYSDEVRMLLRIKTKNFHPGKYGKYVRIDPFSLFKEIETIFLESFFFKHGNNFQHFLENRINELPAYKKGSYIEFGIQYKIAIEYCLENRNKIVSEIVASKETLLNNKFTKENQLVQ